MQALAVDDEPEPFWDGSDATDRIESWRERVGWRSSWGRAVAPARGGTSHAQDVVAVLDDLDLSCACFYGHSMGGRIGFEVARHAPDRLTGSIVSGAHPFGGSSKTAEQFIAVLRQGAEAFVAVWEGLGPVSPGVGRRLRGLAGQGHLEARDRTAGGSRSTAVPMRPPAGGGTSVAPSRDPTPTPRWRSLASLWNWPTPASSINLQRLINLGLTHHRTWQLAT